jgi:hypothetical protein
MTPPREATLSVIHDMLEATNRHFGGPAPIRFNEADLDDIFGPEYRRILGAVEELLELLPNSGDGTLEVKWGHDDEGNFGSLPPNEGDGPDSEDAKHEETVAFTSWDVIRTACAVYIVPHGNSGGPVAIWFTPFDPTDTGEPRAHGYVDQD